jgi:UBX domain-containing protein 1
MAAGDAERAPPTTAAQSLVESFCAVTSATPQEAFFFLESHTWALESAVRSFSDSAVGDADAADPMAPPAAQPAAGDVEESEDEDYVGGGAGDEEEEDEDYVGDDDDEDAALAAAAAAAEERRRPSKRMKKSHDASGGSGSRPSGASGRGNVKTLSDLGGGNREAGSDEDSDEDDEWPPPPSCTPAVRRVEWLLEIDQNAKTNLTRYLSKLKRRALSKDHLILAGDLQGALVELLDF